DDGTPETDGTPEEYGANDENDGGEGDVTDDGADETDDGTDGTGYGDNETQPEDDGTHEAPIDGPAVNEEVDDGSYDQHNAPIGGADEPIYEEDLEDYENAPSTTDGDDEEFDVDNSGY
ncbi:hypothetical protein BGZ52_008387, partial [Haplosporangium bisporale]